MRCCGCCATYSCALQSRSRAAYPLVLNDCLRLARAPPQAQKAALEQALGNSQADLANMKAEMDQHKVRTGLAIRPKEPDTLYQCAH